MAAPEEDGSSPTTTDYELLAADGGLKLKKTRTSEGRFPKAGEELTVNYRGYVNDDEYYLGKRDAFDDSYDRGQPFTFVLGRGQVIPGWDGAFPKLRVGEAGIIECNSDYAYGEEGHPPKIPPCAKLVFEVELLEAKPKPKELFEMTEAEKLEEAAKAKAKGLELFKTGEKFHEAKEQFYLACHFCDAGHYTREDKPMPEEVASTFVSCQLNASQCALKTKDWPEAARTATAALKVVEGDDPHAKKSKSSKKKLPVDDDGPRVRGLYRRGVARGHMGLLAEAREDLQQAARLDPKNRAVRVELQRIKERALAQKKSQQSAFKAVFDRVDLFPEKPRNVKNPSATDNPYAFLTFRYDDDGPPIEKKVVLRVFADACPRTARNFLSLCAGDRGVSKNSAKKLHYKNCKVVRVVKDFMIQAGDVVCDDGTSGESIYGRFFDDEHFKLKHDKPGVLSMANKGPNTNASQFFITVDEAPHCDGKSVAFGCVVAGMDVVHEIANRDTESDESDKPKSDVLIVDCGALSKDDAELAMVLEEESKRFTEKQQVKDDEPSAAEPLPPPPAPAAASEAKDDDDDVPMEEATN
mmetsp:Transcript_34083/g.109376  ORF Transcript_34083/g.109376 Transcript_34083/m.109376 type:complete len:582 (-) Transcript_34083:1469-3214(-)